MKTQQIALLAVALFLVACGPQTPVGTFVYTYTDPPPDMTKLSRLVVEKDKNGITTITDRLMDGQACTWLLNKGCELRCFPVEPMWPGCDETGILYYTRQGLEPRFKWGRVETVQDPSCGGQNTYMLVELHFVEKVDRREPVYICGQPQQSLRLSLYDRNWYRAQSAAFLPASDQDLPISDGRP